MFTGIIEHCGTLQSIQRQAAMLEIWIASAYTDLVLGESIAVEGICLTVSAIKSAAFACILSPETLRITSAGQFKPGQFVNLERALRVLDRLGGHIVQGHVDETGTVIAVQAQQDCLSVEIGQLSDAAQSYLIPKGSISVNGVSLTINQISKQAFQLMLIPHTLALTNLKFLQVGDRVNIEFDWLTKVVKQQVQHILNTTALGKAENE